MHQLRIAEIVFDEPHLRQGEITQPEEIRVDGQQLFLELGAVVDPSAQVAHGFHRFLAGEIFKGQVSSFHKRMVVMMMNVNHLQ